MVIKLLENMLGNEGNKILIEVDGKLTKRRVYYRSSCGLFILVNNTMIFAYDFFTNDTFTYDKEVI